MFNKNYLIGGGFGRSERPNLHKNSALKAEFLAVVRSREWPLKEFICNVSVGGLFRSIHADRC